MLLGVLRFYTFPFPSNRNLALNKDENQNNANKDEGGNKVHEFVFIRKSSKYPLNLFYKINYLFIRLYMRKVKHYLDNLRCY